MSIFDFRQDPLHMIALAFQHVDNIVDCLAVKQKGPVQVQESLKP